MPNNSIKGFKVGNEVKKYDYNELDNLPENDPDDLAEEVNDLKSDLSDVENRLIPIDGIIALPTFEKGSVYASNGVLTYSNNAKRIRMPQGTSLHLNIGDIVHIDSGYKVGVNYSVDGGATYTWQGFVNHNWSVSNTGEYALFIEQSTDITDVKETESHVMIQSGGTTALANISDLLTFKESVRTSDDNLLSNAEWALGVIGQSSDAASTNTLKTVDYISVENASTVTLSCANGYKYYYLLYDENKTVLSAHSFLTTTFVVDVLTEGASYIRLCLRKTSNENMDVSESENMYATYSNAILQAKQNIEHISNRVNVVENIFRFDKFFSHLGVSQTTNIIIPSQSLADVMRAKRLGFKCLEINVQKTSDNEYICLHGSSGKFGAQFIGADGSDVSTISVSSKTLEWIAENVRYVSKYEKYQTAPFTLQKILRECKKLGVVPYLQYVDDNEVAIADQIMGRGNYILGLYGYDRVAKTDAVCGSHTEISNVDDAIAKCKASGQCYFLGVNHAASGFANFTDDDWYDYVNAVHDAGYYVAGAYINNASMPKFIGYGFDVVASRAQINDFPMGNVCNLFSDIDFNDFATTGTINNGEINLSVEQTIVPKETLENVFLGGGSLHIRFAGRIYVNMGKIGIAYTSDGESDEWFSTYFEEESPTFRITAATAGATIYDISYKASKM